MSPRGLGLNRPCDYVTTGDWPHARLATSRVGVVEAAVAQELARRLVAALNGRSLREVARSADVAHTTLAAIVRGERWAELPTIVRLERALDADLWPGRLSPTDG